MTPVDDESMSGHSGSESPRMAEQIDQQSVAGLESISAALDADALEQSLQNLIKRHGDRFDPVRIRYIQALMDNAARLSPSAASIVEKKATQVFSAYLNDFRAARESAAALVEQVAAEAPQDADIIRRLFECGEYKAVQSAVARRVVQRSDNAGSLASLSREVQLRNRETTTGPSLEDELRQQELQVKQSLADAVEQKCNEKHPGSAMASLDRRGAMDRFRQSLHEHHARQRITRVIQDGPDDPGPLNAQRLVIQSLSMMRALSPSYTTRFVAYMESLLWLDQAARTAEKKKSKGASGRKP